MEQNQTPVQERPPEGVRLLPPEETPGPELPPKPSRPAKRPPRRGTRLSLPALAAALAVLVAVLALIKAADPFAPAPEESGDPGVAGIPEWIEIRLLPENPYSRPGDPLEQVNGVVVHYVGNPGTSAEQNHGYFENLASTGETYASSHFLIGLNGEVLLNVPLDEIAYSSNYRNIDTVSIECCHPDATGEFTAATYQSLLSLTRWLMETYGLDSGQLLRHFDVTGKECPRYFVQHPEAWEQFLADAAE